MITKHETSFTVYPEHCNPNMEDGQLTVHGGAMLMAMDRCAADLCRLALYDAQPIIIEVFEPFHDDPVRIARTALTVGVEDVVFHSGAKLGDLIFLRAELVKLGVKRMEVRVLCYISEPQDESPMCEGTFIFCSVSKPGRSLPHGLTL